MNPTPSLSRLARTLLALLLVAGSAQAADPLAAAFRKASKAAVAAVKLATKEAGKGFQQNQKSVLTAYKVGKLDAASAVAESVAGLVAARDELEDTALAVVTQLAADGVALLVEAGSPAPGPDFQAGGQGAWDAALAGIDAALGRTDARLRKTFARFAAAFAKAAAKQGAELDLRWKLPAHGRAFWRVTPPAAVPGPGQQLAGPRALDVAPPQVLIAVRFVETSTPDQLDLGLRGGDASVTPAVSSTAAESLALDELFLDGSGRALGAFPLVGLAHPEGFIALSVAGLTAESQAVALSAPRLGAPGDAATEIAKTLGQDLALARKSLAQEGGAALAQLAQQLASHLTAVAKGQATIELALRTGWANLHAARRTLAGEHANGLQDAVFGAGQALAGAGLQDGDLFAGLAPDAAGPYTAGAAALDLQLALRQSQASALYEAFAAKLRKLAAASSGSLAFNVVVGRTDEFGAPMLSLAPTPPQVSKVLPVLTDALVLLVHPLAGDDQLTVLVTAQADPEVLGSIDITATTIPGGDTTLLAGLILDPFGTPSTEVPLLADIPVLGWLFRAGADEATQREGIVIVRPTLVQDP